MRIFYKFLLNIKPSYICCHLNKQTNEKKPIRFSRAWSLQKSHYFIGRLRENSWYSSFNFLKARRVQVRAISDRNWKMCVMVFKIELLSVCASASSPCILLLLLLLFFNWDLLHARLNSHYEAWSYKKRSRKKVYRYRKSV